MSIEQFLQIIYQLSEGIKEIKKELTEFKKNLQPKRPSELLTRQEVADYFKCDISTIHNWTKKGKLIAYKKGDRVYYKQDEVEIVDCANKKGGKQ
jgi:excisionase family DNA binding protein